MSTVAGQSGKESGPSFQPIGLAARREGPALISPQSGGGCHSSSYGMKEWWNNGILGIKTEIILILTSYLEMSPNQVIDNTHDLS